MVKKTTPSLEERGITKRDIIKQAQKVKNDEFYTRYEDIEKELSMYDKKIWKNKTVFCNCDDAVDTNEKRTPAFALYFLNNFKELELKKLICAHFGGPVDLSHQGAKGYIFTKDGFREIHEKKEYPEGYTGSFDDPLSLKILNEETDIVCTNPPFSKSVDYWDMLIKSGKKFLIISNEVIVINTAYIPYFMNKKAWAGYHEVYWFLNAKKELTRASGHWFTNFPVKNRKKEKNLKIVPLNEIPKKYLKHDDNTILLVDNGFIPHDYKKKFAVSSNPLLNGLLDKGYKIVYDKKYIPSINNKECFARVLVQKE